ncbi:MAG: Type 1 glutamine amidotransferase-like domain-containing protein [Carnobacterium alterfunditum]|uniref:Type 1 glutamine amidotransferase-like domain-containing protein n=1 Tax=Planococcus halocryophilus TaxID=1215089 RepID=UPI001F0FE4BF|nr:Type 1 glutamine amidotransferase-like domain-containing protein [Planococcus halocryophilus]MCH4827251.1 Type 1 glutamine amidotransferase-like domain-containing protein [Planococcus halocryophilus]
MNTHYYLGWFTDFFPERLSQMLRDDITDRKSLVMISSNPLDAKVDGTVERSWLDHAGILFDDYYLINHGIKKEAAHTLIQNASVIFLLGGDTLKQNEFLMAYGMSECIRKSNAVVIGASAGAINMSAKWLCSKNFGYQVKENAFYNGIGLDNFSVLSHFDLENNMALVQSELSSLSVEMKIYASNKDCALRIKGDKIDIFGNVYAFSHSKIQKLKETF